MRHDYYVIKDSTFKNRVVFYIKRKGKKSSVAITMFENRIIKHIKQDMKQRITLF